MFSRPCRRCAQRGALQHAQMLVTACRVAWSGRQPHDGCGSPPLSLAERRAAYRRPAPRTPTRGASGCQPARAFVRHGCDVLDLCCPAPSFMRTLRRDAGGILSKPDSTTRSNVPPVAVFSSVNPRAWAPRPSSPRWDRWHKGARGTRTAARALSSAPPPPTHVLVAGIVIWPRDTGPGTNGPSIRTRNQVPNPVVGQPAPNGDTALQARWYLDAIAHCSPPVRQSMAHPEPICTLLLRL